VRSRMTMNWAAMRRSRAGTGASVRAYFNSYNAV
jgi:hypothetical protein